MEVKFNKLDSYYIDDFDLVKVKTTAPHLHQVTYNKNPNTKARIKNIDKEHYKDLKTGEVKKKKHIEKRSDSKPSIGKTRQKIIDVINTNATDTSRVKFVTLTYKDVMNDSKKFDIDLNLFVKNFNYKYKINRNIKVCAPQLRGSYHAHILFIFDDKAPFIPYEEIRNMWGHGNVDVRNVENDVNNLGVYLASHLLDVPLEDMKKYNIKYNKKDIKEVKVINGKELDKSEYFVKNGITNIIPPGFRMLRLSRNLKKPKVEKMRYHEARKKVGYGDPTYVKALEIIFEDDSSGFTNYIISEYYNKLVSNNIPDDKNSIEQLYLL